MKVLPPGHLHLTHVCILAKLFVIELAVDAAERRPEVGEAAHHTPAHFWRIE